MHFKVLMQYNLFYLVALHLIHFFPQGALMLIETFMFTDIVNLEYIALVGQKQLVSIFCSSTDNQIKFKTRKVSLL